MLKIAHRYIELAREARVTSNLRVANIHLDKAYGIAPQLPAIALVRAELTKAFDKNRSIAKVRQSGNMRQKRIQKLLESAQNNIFADRLSRPDNNNALKNLREIMKIDPNNFKAKEELEKVAERYVQLANSALKNGELNNVRMFLSKARLINPRLDSIYSVQMALEMSL